MLPDSLILGRQRRCDLPDLQLCNGHKADRRRQIVSKESATFGLLGSRENVVRLDADHRNSCRFDDSMHDQDNFKLVRGNIQELYNDAIRHSQLISRLPVAMTSGFLNAACCMLPNSHSGMWYRKQQHHSRSSPFLGWQCQPVTEVCAAAYHYLCIS